ncbi:MAG TPA: Rid family hydrolase [Pseudobdellovibrionaceae bacterium]|nr:Rid family hydrolase [Pseudobdellovibrionaceae bacterium]
MNQLVTACYIVPGLPHPYLAAHRNPGYKKLAEAFQRVREEIQQSQAEYILYFSTQWLTVLGYSFQADPSPEWVLVDHNWHDLGSIRYKMRVDPAFASLYAREVKAMGHTVREVNYKGFPIDTGTVVAHQFLNPDNRLPEAMVSCNMYAEKQETLSIGQAGMRAIEAFGKKVAIVVVTGLSSRYHTDDLPLEKDFLSSQKDDEWNRKILEILGEGRLEDVSEVAREYNRQANADMGFRAIWWLNGLTGKHNSFTGQVHEYQPIYGTGAALVSLKPTQLIRSIPGWVNDEADLVERMDRERDQARAKSATAKSQASGAERPSASPNIVTFEAHARDASEIAASSAPAPVGPYPHAKRVGDFLFLSGVGPRQPGTSEIPGVSFGAEGEVLHHDVVLQTEAVLKNIKAVLDEAKVSTAKIVDVQVYLTDMKRDFQRFNKVYAQYFGVGGAWGCNPTRTTVEVTALPTPICVELKVTAYLGE